MLVLGFLRSAAKLLVLGPIPSFTTSKKKKKLSEDDDEDEEMPPPEETMHAEGDDEYEFFVPDVTVPSRGTILITLRNVSPYTLWFVGHWIIATTFILMLFQECSTSSQKSTATDVWEHTTQSKVHTFTFLCI